MTLIRTMDLTASTWHAIIAFNTLTKQNKSIQTYIRMNQTNKLIINTYNIWMTRNNKINMTKNGDRHRYGINHDA